MFKALTEILAEKEPVNVYMYSNMQDKKAANVLSEHLTECEDHTTGFGIEMTSCESRTERLLRVSET